MAAKKRKKSTRKKPSPKPKEQEQARESPTAAPENIDVKPPENTSLQVEGQAGDMVRPDAVIEEKKPENAKKEDAEKKEESEESGGMSYRVIAGTFHDFVGDLVEFFSREKVKIQDKHISRANESGEHVIASLDKTGWIRRNFAWVGYSMTWLSIGGDLLRQFWLLKQEEEEQQREPEEGGGARVELPRSPGA